jgi:hypothetical protein
MPVQPGVWLVRDTARDGAVVGVVVERAESLGLAAYDVAA